MKNLIYNQKTKQFYLAPIKLDPSNWKSSYIEMLKEADAQCEAISRSRNFARHEKPVEFNVSRDAEVQYFIFHQIRFNANWVAQYLGKDYSMKNYLSNFSKNAISRIQKFCLELIDNSKVAEAEVFKKYSLGRYKTYKVKIDSFNRFMYKPMEDNNEIEILTVMFHYDDEILRDYCDSDIEFRAKKKLLQIYNSLISDITINPTKLSDYINKKQTESK